MRLTITRPTPSADAPQSNAPNPFQRLNTLTGWGVFAVALITYTMTVERTASFWDCGEFIASAFKLQVPHPPGAPFFLLLGRLFSLLALGDLTQVAYWVNMVSVLASAFTILFLFWTITMLARKLIAKAEAQYATVDTVLVLGAGAVGALAYTFSDTFWYSAVEAEVYSLSSFFTAIVVWAAFAWERIEDRAAANRWLIFIAFLIGLSIGVHLLNLVTLPALGLIYYYKKTKTVTVWGGLGAALGGLVVLGIINVGIIPGLPTMAFAVDRFFVNSLGLPFGAGTVFFVIAFLGTIAVGVAWSARRGRSVLNTALLALTFVLLGYGSYLQVLVRAGYNPPINENDPSDSLNFLSYLKREQYESRSLAYGPSFMARPVDQKRGAPVYRKDGNKYVVRDYRPDYIYEPGDEMPFPRLGSRQAGHAQLYQQMLNLPEGKKPTMGNNLYFLFSHQLGHMYWRYLMWNFAGRDSDEEGAGYLLPTSSDANAPDLLKANKAHDNFYMLPFLLGLLGMVFQYYRRRSDFWVVGLLFLFTGVALQIFINSPPQEPRERDYIYAGSFYFFAMWLGLGVMAIAEGIRAYLKNDFARNATVAGVCLLVPALMAARSWDNHDRNHRYHSVDSAKNLLNSCAPNAILFTGGDNDTFPLWYVQEVEGFRTDVRIVCLSLLGAPWYIQQMKRKLYQTDAVPITLEYDNFAEGKNDIVPFYEVPAVKNGIDLKQYIDLVKQNSQAVQVPLTTGEMTSVLPSSVLFLPIDKAAVKQAGFVPACLQQSIPDTMTWTIGKRDLYKADLIVLDIIATNNWKRPIYFASTIGTDSYLNLKDHMQLEGYAYRLMPTGFPEAKDGFVNTEMMYDTMMHKTFWRELDNPDTYYPQEGYGTAFLGGRIAFMRLTDELIREGKLAKAKEVMDHSMTVMPDDSIPFDQISANNVRFMFIFGETQRALETADIIATRANQNLTYYQETGRRFGDTNGDLYSLQTIVEACKAAGQTVAASKYNAIFQKYINAVG